MDPNSWRAAFFATLPNVVFLLNGIALMNCSSLIDRSMHPAEFTEARDQDTSGKRLARFLSREEFGGTVVSRAVFGEGSVQTFYRTAANGTDRVEVWYELSRDETLKRAATFLRPNSSVAIKEVQGDDGFGYLLSFDPDDLRPSGSITRKFSSATYQVSFEEFDRLLSRKQTYGGPESISFTRNHWIQAYANHSPHVIRGIEPSLTRLVAELINKLPKNERTRENIVQALRDFAMNEFYSDDDQSLFGKERLKMPHETLLTGRGDCSNRSILLASLLEQVGEDYLFALWPASLTGVGHASVFVKKGNFDVEEASDDPYPHKYQLGQETFLHAEASASNDFKIGKTRLAFLSRRPALIHRPRDIQSIVDVKAACWIKTGFRFWVNPCQ